MHKVASCYPQPSFLLYNTMSQLSAKSLQKTVQDFLASGSHLRIIYNPSLDALANSNTRRICVLDSSFNPPHLGHYALIKESLSYKNQFPKDNQAVLLLFSVKNADKVTAAPAALEHRLAMMCLMADYVQKKMQVNVSVGITDHAKFVDKSSTILRYLKEQNLLAKLTFLVGFDTLLRILNPNYYLPDKILAALSEFMGSTDLFCLTRNDEKLSVADQSLYVQTLRSGGHEDLPSIWSQSISLHTGEIDIVGAMSSSKIRKEVGDGHKEWHNEVIPEIHQYIVEQSLYKKLE